MESKQKFEDKMSEIEKIINELENGNADLDESIEKYTKAMKLVKECDDKLKKVEEQISKIVLENSEEKDFDL